MPVARLNSLIRIIQHYRQHCAKNALTELDPFKSYDFTTALRHAALASRPDGKRFDHQRRLSTNTLNRALTALNRIAPQLRRAKSFDALHTLIEKHTRPIPGIGPLYIYDTSLRLASHLKLSPSRIYLHAGARIGAKNLGLPTNQSSLPKSAFPRPFQNLAACQIEDILCIYKHRLRRLLLSPRSQF